MATILPQPIGRSKTKVQALKIDMTPMVDLGFLLISFFIFTTQLTLPATTKLIMPKQENEVSTVYEKTLLTALIDRNSVYVYEGAFDKATAAGQVAKTGFNFKTGLGAFIRAKQKQLAAINKKEDLVVAIKPLSSASYQDVMNALDEMQINKVRRYTIIDLSEDEKKFTASKR